MDVSTHKILFFSLKLFILLIIFWKVCNKDTREFQLIKGIDFDIMNGARAKLLINSFTKDSVAKCMVECGLDCECLMIRYEDKNCEIYKIQVKDYLNMTQNQSSNVIIYYKKDMLTEPIYIQNGMLSFNLILLLNLIK